MWTLKSHKLKEISHNTRLILPSKRYMDLLRNGAKKAKIDEDYIKFLEECPTFKNSKISCVLGFFLKILLGIMFITGYTILK